ncbi:MAG: LptF/LptG family permease [Nitrospirota bacterium]
MKIIHKSILKELALTFLLSLAFLNFILMMEKLLRLSRFLSGVGASMMDIGKIIFYLQPQLLLLTIPMSLLLSTLLIYGRLNYDSELVVLRLNGMSFWSISMPVFASGIICFLLCIAVSFYIGPGSSIKLRDEITNIIKTRSPLSIEEGTFNTSFKDIVIIIREKPSADTLKGIFIYDGRDKNEPRVLIAEEGKIYMPGGFDIGLYLKDGYIHITNGDSTTELSFKKYNMILSLESESPSRKNAELTPSELLQEIKGAGAGQALPLLLEFHRRLSLPGVCIILIFLGPPLALMAGSSGKLGGLTIGLSVFTVYYMLLIYGENLVRAGKIPHYIGAWSPTIILGIFALWMFKKENSK